MNFNDLAKSYIRQAKERLKHAEEALNNRNYPYVVRQSQEAVELLLKASLRLVGVEPPKWHYVGPIIRRELDRFPRWFSNQIDYIVSVSRSLRKERELAMYGDEEMGIPPEELYTEIDATEALEKARKILNIVEKLYREVSSNK